MNDPVKIIYKYKNLNRKNQHQILIFVGNLLSPNIQKILKKIKDKNLYDTLIDLTTKEYDILKIEYGEFWYKYFFTSHHINHTFNIIIKRNPTKKREITERLGKDWYNTHIDRYTKANKITYSYQNQFKQQNDIKNISKGINIKELDEDNINYQTIIQSSSIVDMNVYDILQYGGKKDKEVLTPKEQKNDTSDNEDDTQNDNEDEQDDDQENNIIENQIEDILYNQVLITNNEDEFNLDELDKMIKEEVNIDIEADKTKDKIEEIILKTEQSKYLDDLYQIQKWDTSKDNSMYDEDLSNVYSKIYIYNQYINKDDTIINIKKKVCCGYQKSRLFSVQGLNFLPSRLYLWSSYEFYDTNGNLNKEKIMLGQKWIRRNELLNIDIEPNDNIRTYETLKGNLKLLQENIKKYASKISHEDDENNILDDYVDYMTDYEIYMIDIYNDIGLNYDTTEEQLKNLYDIYVRIYYYTISLDEFRTIIDYVNNKKEGLSEITKIITVNKTIHNDLVMDNEIIKNIEELKKTPMLYYNIFKDNYITQAVVHLTIKHQNFKNIPKIELYRIFDNFIANDKYPFVQFQTPDSKLVFKFFSQGTEKNKDAILSKWFENAPYGISFKIKCDGIKGGVENRYIAVSLNENGRLDYKIQWKEDDKATFEDINKSYDEIRILLRKINGENNKLKVEIPNNDKFKFAFINTIQQFELPEKYTISHNDLSDFARYFYPYIAVVVEPKKRQSKILKKNDKSKYGTYLRYKRISKYDNEVNIEKRILYYIRNYEFNEKLLALEISKQFNITDKTALDKIRETVDKNPGLKKSRNILKKLDDTSKKYKPPGIGVDIQGKSRENYKIRISGARSKNQLNKIINFMNILIYLYIETYIYKRQDKQKFKDKLIGLTNIAKRRNRVEEIVEQPEIISNIKQITKIDKERLGFKPEKGQNQWTRSCQKSGDKKRRPTPFTDKTLNDMIKQGYIYNKETNNYELETSIKVGNRKINKTLKAVKIDNYDGQGNNIYYTCDPKENGEYVHIGFLSKSSNPYGHCMPCCFKKDPEFSNNTEKRNYHLKCIGKLDDSNKTKIMGGEKLYILQDSNKTQDGRFSYLPPYLDIFLNTMLNKTKNIKNNYLIESTNGYFFKYGFKQDDDIYLMAVSLCLDISVDQIKKRISEVLMNDKLKNEIFNSLNNGDITTQFGTIENYLRFIHTNFEVGYELVNDILSIPEIILPQGLNIYIFEEKYNTNKETQFNIKTDYNIIYGNIENISLFSNNTRSNIILLKEDTNYYPIFLVFKEETSKDIEIIKSFNIKNDKNIIDHLYQYLKINTNKIDLNLTNQITAKETYDIFKNKNLEKNITGQIIDKRHKAKYLILENKYLFPVKPSGSLYYIKINNNYEKYLNDFDQTITKLYDYYQKLNKIIKIKPIGLYYSNKNISDDNNFNIEAIIIDKNITVPIDITNMSKDNIIKSVKKINVKDFIIEAQSIYDIIDKELVKGKNNIIVDTRILSVNENNYKNETYELFRLELSDYLKSNPDVKLKITKTINRDIDNEIKKINIKKILYKITSNYLYKLFNKINIDELKNDYIIDNEQDIIQDNDQDIIASNDDSSDYMDDMDLIPIEYDKELLKGGNYDNIDDDNIDENKGKLVHITNKNIDYEDYYTKNNRELCRTNLSKDSCHINKHCNWKTNKCKLQVDNSSLIDIINRIAEELVNNELKSNEILMLDNYFVSDIINPSFYTNRPDQKIIKSNNNNIKKIFSELFGKNNIPIIGKRRTNKITKNINNDNLLYPLETIGQKKYQKIHPNNTIYRAYANSFYWINSKKEEIEQKNLGYYSAFQTDLSNYFKSLVITWIGYRKKQNKLFDDLEKTLNLNRESYLNEFKRYLTRSNEIQKNYIIELYILNLINNIPIIIYDNYDKIICIIDNKLMYLSNYLNNKYNDKYNKYSPKDNIIRIKYNITNFSFTNNPTQISVIY